MQRYRWPIMFFIAVAFWNLVGAGLFGFLINPPLALYYMQGLNLTPLHGHTALFGVYGMLGIGLMLFCLRGLEARRCSGTSAHSTPRSGHSTSASRCMALLTLLPHGHAAAEGAHRARLLVRALGRVHADGRSSRLLVWMRVPGDTIFSIGALSIAWFVFRLWVAPKRAAEELPQGSGPAKA